MKWARDTEILIEQGHFTQTDNKLITLKDILERVPNFSDRGFIKEQSQSIYDAFEEREDLYKQSADHIVQNSGEILSCLQEILDIL